MNRKGSILIPFLNFAGAHGTKDSKVITDEYKQPRCRKAVVFEKRIHALQKEQFSFVLPYNLSFPVGGSYLSR